MEESNRKDAIREVSRLLVDSLYPSPQSSAPGENEDEVPDELPEWRKYSEVAIEGLSLILTGVGFFLPGVGALAQAVKGLTFVLDKVSKVNSKLMSENLTLYLRLVSGKMNIKFQNLSSKMKDSFNDLSSDVVMYDFKQEVEDKARTLYTKFNAIFDDLSQTKIDDFMRECRKNEPIDVLYTMYKRITKSQSDLNPVWKKIIAANYDDKVFGPWKDYIGNTAVYMMICQIMYLACEYKDERDLKTATYDDDVKEMEILIDLVLAVHKAVDDLDTKRKETYFDKVIEKVVHDAAFSNDDQKPEKRIIDQLKSRYVWHDFMVLTWIYVKDSTGTHDWAIDANDRLKYFKKEINGRYWLIIQLTSELKNNRNADLDKLNGSFEGTFLTQSDPEPGSLATRINKNRKEPSFAFVLQFRSKFGNNTASASKQDLQYTSTNGSKFTYKWSCPQYDGFTESNIFGNPIRLPVKWYTNRNIFAANSAGPAIQGDGWCSMM